MAGSHLKIGLKITFDRFFENPPTEPEKSAKNVAVIISNEQKTST